MRILGGTKTEEIQKEKKFFRKIITSVLEFIYPPVCPFCGTILSRKEKEEKRGICFTCREKLPYIKEPCCMKCGKPLREKEQEFCADCAKHSLSFDQGRSLYLHTSMVQRAVYQFKFHNRRYYAEIFAEEMTQNCKAWIRRWEIEEIIPVPLHPSRRRERGFNQAELLAKELGKRTGIPVNTKAVSRIRKTKYQKQLDDIGRRQNLKGAFSVDKKWKPKRSVLIVDDIYTTGNTMHRVSEVLKKAGAQKVYFLTISIGQGL